MLCLGELLVDCFGEARRPGGAPANVACHVASLGHPAALVSKVGDDTAGRELRRWLYSKSVATQHVQSDAHQPTGAVNVSAGPRYEISAPAAWDFIQESDDALAAASAAGAVVFGTLAQRQPVSRRSVRRLVEAARAAGVPVLCDLNLRAPFYDEETVLWCLRHCDVLKLNGVELEIVSGFLGATGAREDLFVGLLREFGVDRGVLTEGESGALVYEYGYTGRSAAAAVTKVIDTVGAGDAFAAVLAAAISRGVPFSKATPAAAALSAHVVSHQGATPEVPLDLAVRINAMLAV